MSAQGARPAAPVGWIAVADHMPEAAQDDGDILYCRVVYDATDRPADRRVGYFDGGEWKDVSGYKFATYGGTVTHWFAPPALLSGAEVPAGGQR